MRKLFIVLMLILGVIVFGQNSFAQTNLIKHYYAENDTASETVTNVSTTTIIVDRTNILGFEVLPTRSHSYSSYASLWDEAAATAHSINNLFGEAEAVAGSTENEVFPYPKRIGDRLEIILGPYSAVVVYYTK